MRTRLRLIRSRIKLLNANRWFPTFRFEVEHQGLLSIPTGRNMETWKWKRRAKEDKTR